MPDNTLLCHGVKCSDTTHCMHIGLCKYTNSLIQVCLLAAQDSIPHTRSSKSCHYHTNPIPGCDEYVVPTRKGSIIWHNLWIDCGRLRSGVVADCMRRTGVNYYFAIRRVRRHESDMIKKRFARTILENRTRDFWCEVNRMKNSKSGVCQTIDSLSDPGEIANMFADKYQDLYKSVSFDHNDKMSVKAEISSNLKEYNVDCVVNFKEVVQAIDSLKPGKNDGYAGLSSKHIMNGCDELSVHMSLLFSSIRVHGVAFDDFYLSSIIPIPKGKMLCSLNFRQLSRDSMKFHLR